MSKFNIFEFKLGKDKKSLQEWIKIGAIIHFSLDVISSIPGVEKKKVFNIIDTIQQKLNIEVLNDYIIRDDELLGYRIEKVLNKSIKNYESTN
jgi:hypothetical protein